MATHQPFSLHCFSHLGWSPYLVLNVTKKCSKVRSYNQSLFVTRNEIPRIGPFGWRFFSSHFPNSTHFKYSCTGDVIIELAVQSTFISHFFNLFQPQFYFRIVVYGWASLLFFFKLGLNPRPNQNHKMEIDFLLLNQLSDGQGIRCLFFI